MADRQTKALTIFTQGSVGTAEPERSTYHSIHERLEFSHKEYAQAEYAARLMADSIADAWSDVGRGDASQVRRPRPLRALRHRLPRGDEGQVVPGAVLAPLSGRVELPHRPDARGGPQHPRGRPARLRQPGRQPRVRRARQPARTGQPRPEHRRLPAHGRARARELLRPLLRGAGGGPEHPPPGVPAGGDPVHGVLLRAVEGPGHQHQDAHRQGGRQPVQRLRLGSPTGADVEPISRPTGRNGCARR